MSGPIKSIASIALPIIGTAIAPGIGTALGSSLSGAALAGIGGAVGGGLGGAISGGGVKGILTGAALGGAGGYLSSGGLGELGITGPGSLLGEATPAGGETVSSALALADKAATPSGAAPFLGAGSGTLGSVTQAISPVTSVLSGGSGSVNGLTLPILAGNTISGILGANASEDAAKKQLQATQAALAQQRELQQPYVDAGTGALSQYTSLSQSPQAQRDFVLNNPLYQGLAQDAQRRLLAQKATAGKIASGGTANELQNQLLNLGNNLVSTQLGYLQPTVNTGANAAAGLGAASSDLITQGGNAQAAGTIGPVNAYNSAYQNTINSLLALQNLNRNTYFPAITG